MATKIDSRQIKNRSALPSIGSLANAELNDVLNSVDSAIGNKVSGPASSTDEAIARFDTATGKIIQNSVATITDAGVAAGFTGFTSSGTVTASGTLSATGSITEGISTDSTTTGANATLSSPTTPFVRLTNASLTSIDTISAPVSGRVLTIENFTGNVVTFNNDTGANTANRIYTGTKAPLTVSDQASIIVKYDSVNSRWMVIGGTGSGTGTGGGLDTFYTEDMEALANTSTFAQGNNATFLGGGTLQGTLALESVAPISKLKSLKYTQAAGSLNDYFASPLINLDLKQRDETCGMTLYFTYNGNDNDMKFVVWDVTNSRELSNQVSFVKLAGQPTRYSLSFYVPQSCTQIRWGAQVLVVNNGKILVVDDVEMSTNPFVSVELLSDDSSIRLDTSNGYGSTANKIRRFSNLRDRFGIDVIYTDSATNGATFTVATEGVYSISYTDSFAVAQIFGISKNTVSPTTSIATIAASERLSIVINSLGTASWTGNLQVGDVIRAHTDGTAGANNDRAIFTMAKVGTASEHILTPSDTFSSDTAPLTYAGSAQFTLATLSNAPIGTYITFKYATSTNTRTQTTGVGVGDLRPTQTDADMNVNGIRLFTRAFNAASTGELPAAIAVQIGKGLKGVSNLLYKSTGRVTSGSLDFVSPSSGVFQGCRIKDYNESTGILVLDAGFSETGNTSCSFVFSDLTAQTNGYLTISAGKTLPLLAVPVPQTVYLKDVKTSGTAGGTFTSGAWQTRTLNTVEGDTSILSLSANQFTLGPGRYEVEASAPAFFCNKHQAKLRSITNSLDVILGTSEQAEAVSTGNDVTRSMVSAVVVITAPTVFELQHRCTTTRASDGFGLSANFGVSEVYSILKIKKVW